MQSKGNVCNEAGILYPELCSIQTYEEWERRVDTRQLSSQDTEPVIIQIFRTCIANINCADCAKTPLIENTIKYLNKKLGDKKFFQEQAYTIAKISSSHFNVVLPKFSNALIRFDCMPNERSHNFKSVNVLPLLVESSYFRILCTGSFREANSDIITIQEINPMIFSAICKYIETNDFKSIESVQKDLFTVYEYLQMWDMPRRCLAICKKYDLFNKYQQKIRTNNTEIQAVLQAMKLITWCNGEERELLKVIQSHIHHYFNPCISAQEMIRLILCVASYSGCNHRELKIKCFEALLAQFELILKIVQNEQKQDMFTYCLQVMQGWKVIKVLPDLPFEALEIFMHLIPGEQIQLRCKHRAPDFKKVIGILPTTLKKIDIERAIKFGDAELQQLVMRCPDIECLQINHATITNLGLLKPLVSLKKLSLPGAQRARLDTLPNLENVKEVDFSYTKISDFKHLQRLPNLECVKIIGTDSADLSLIDLCANLKKLDISKCSVAVQNPKSVSSNKTVSIEMKEVYTPGSFRFKLRKMYPYCTFIFDEK